ncbi:MAG TPA: hypothetical protein VIU44_05345, partial [Gaiellaceae bacterium]
GQLAGAVTLSATATGLTGDSSALTVVPGTATQLAFTGSTADLASATARTLRAEVRDAAGNIVTGDSTTVVTFSKSAGAGSVTGLGTATASAGVATLDVTGQLAGALTIGAAATGLAGDSTSFAVVPGAATQLAFTSSTADLASGATRTLTVEIRDAAGNRTADSSTAVTIVRTSGVGTVTGLGTATASGGIASLDVTGQLVGPITLGASATGLTGATSSFAVVHGAGVALAVTSSTSDLTANTARTLVAEIHDAAGNIVTSDSATSVTFAKTAGAGTLTGLGSATASSGIASLDVTGGTVGAVTVTASGGGFSTDSTSFAVVHGTAASLAVTSATTNLTAGGARTLTAEVRDAQGNVVTDDSTTVVTFAKTSGAGTVTGLGTATASGGVASLPVTGDHAGSVTLGATSGSLTAGSTSFAVVPGAAASLAFTSSSADLSSGASRTLTVEIRDAHGNVVTGDGSTSVDFAQTSGSGSLTGLGAATASSGVASKTVTGSISGPVTVTASATGLGSDTASFTIVDGLPASVVFTSGTSDLTSGGTRTLTAEIRDGAGNLVNADNSTSVTFAQGAGSGSVSGLGSATAVNGVASLTVTGVVAGPVTITADASGLTGDSSSFAVVPGAAASLHFTSSTADLASGAARTLTAQLR